MIRIIYGETKLDPFFRLIVQPKNMCGFHTKKKKKEEKIIEIPGPSILFPIVNSKVFIISQIEIDIDSLSFSLGCWILLNCIIGKLYGGTKRNSV